MVKEIKVIKASDGVELKKYGVIGVCTMYGMDLEDVQDGVTEVMMSDMANPERLCWTMQTSIGESNCGTGATFQYWELNRGKAGTMETLKVVNAVLFESEAHKEVWDMEEVYVKEYLKKF